MSIAIDYSSGAFEANKAQGVGTITAGTGTYNLAVASYDSVSFSVASQVPVPASLYFRPDGLKLYVVDGSTNGDVYQYSLSTAWDITTISYDNINQSSIGESSPQGLFFKPDGTKMYITGFNSDAIKEINLSTAWDISIISVYQSFSVLSQTSTPTGIHFNYDGTLVFITGTGEDSVFKYSLSTAWNVSTASLSQTLDISAQESNPQDIFLSANGNKLFVTGQNGVVIDEYYLSTAYDLSTASHTTSFSTSSQENNLRAAFFKSDGTKMYVSGAANDTIFQYSTGTATSLDISSGTYFNYTPSANTTFTFANAPASGTAAGFALAVTGVNVGTGYDIANASYDNKSFDISGQETLASALFFKPDGTKMYMTGGNADSVFEYDLSTAFDVSTASYNNVSYYYGAPPGITEALFFRADGLKWYSIDRGEDKVYEYNMSTAWDITSSSLNQSLGVSNKEAAGRGLFFSSDGTKMYICGAGLSTANQYNLSTAWDISTASHSSTFSVSSQDVFPHGISIKSDGTKMYIVGSNTDTVYQYSLSTAYDLSTASYDSVSFSVQSQDSLPFGFYLKPDGTKMYIAGRSNDTIFQYSTGSSATATLSYPASIEWPSGTAPDGPAINETDVLVFLTDDGGVSYQGFQAGDAMS